MRPARGLLLGAVALAALVFPATASACSCAGPGPGDSWNEHVREDIRSGDAAIVGRLLSVTRPEQGDGPVGPGIAWFRYRILYVVKGKPRLHRDRVVAVKTSGDEASCGLHGRIGSRQGLVLRRSGGRWWGSLCSQYGPKLMRAQGSMEAGGGRRSGCPS